jgi:hypothetical protein
MTLAGVNPESLFFIISHLPSVRDREADGNVRLYLKFYSDSSKQGECVRIRPAWNRAELPSGVLHSGK